MILQIMFNEKWKFYLCEGFYGLDIDNKYVIDFLDAEFEKEIKINPNFQYKQIKMKIGACRIYATSAKVKEWELKVDEIIHSLTELKR